MHIYEYIQFKTHTWNKTWSLVIKCCNFNLMNHESNSLESQGCSLPVESFFLVQKRCTRGKHADRKEKTIRHILNAGTPARAAWPGMQLFGTMTLGGTEAPQTDQARTTLTPNAHARAKIVKIPSRLLCLMGNWRSFKKWEDVDVDPDRLAWFLKKCAPCESCVGADQRNWFLFGMKRPWIQKPKQMKLQRLHDKRNQLWSRDCLLVVLASSS